MYPYPPYSTTLTRIEQRCLEHGVQTIRRGQAAAGGKLLRECVVIFFHNHNIAKRDTHREPVAAKRTTKNCYCLISFSSTRAGHPLTCSPPRKHVGVLAVGVEDERRVSIVSLKGLVAA